MIIDERIAAALRRIPPGNCYTGAYAMLWKSPMRANERLRLCHGVVKQTKPPFEPMGHAWVEETLPGGRVLCYDYKRPMSPIPRERYYEVGAVREDAVVRYTWFEAKRMQDRTGMVGPWDPVVCAAAHGNE